MAVCRKCGKSFDVDEVRDEFDSEPQFEGLSYDEDFPDHNFCYECAYAYTVENLAAGADFMFELETGRPREDRDEEFNW